MAESLINGRAYDYADIQINILGVNLVGISAISYTVEQEKTNNFGTGAEPVSRGRGTKNPTGSLAISMVDVEALRSVAPNGDLLDIPAFRIVVIFNNTGNVVRNHILENVEFTDDGVETQVGDTEIARTFGLIIGKVNTKQT